MSKSKDIPKKLITTEDLANLLSVSKEAVYSWVAQRKIPFFRFGKSLRFDREQIEKWKEKRCFSAENY